MTSSFQTSGSVDSSVGSTGIQITQLFEHIELYAEGTPPRNTLFLLGAKSTPTLTSSIQFTISLDDQLEQNVDELLLIDPPEDASERFRLEGNVAALYTTTDARITLPQIQTKAGGVAHIRIGEHFLDIYSFQAGNIVHLPALGIICSGSWGSDSALPCLAEGSGGDDELDALRLLASLVKRGHFQLLIPQQGTIEREPVNVIRRLADDVGYLHAMRRVVQATSGRRDELETLLAISDTLLPPARSSSAVEERHLFNLQALYLSELNK